MRRQTLMYTAASMALVLATTACMTDPYTGQQTINRTAVGIGVGALGGYLLGDVIGGDHDRNAKVIGVGIGALAGGVVGNYMDQQEAELRRQTAGTGVDVYRQGDELVLRMPSGITFQVDQSNIQPQFQSTLDQVAQTLASYNQTYIDVLGHTDSTGSDAYNQALSERRAQSVADYLAGRGVARARIGTRGYGETQLIATNDTDAGRAENRRVEIKVVPVTQPGY
ncbi:OmpA family protein [Sphingomonas sp. NSE70-1]|uniref:OmpA family protein n=1 Tax=Sphingomonas caseinilyticus TaxID=2908205 RepID=A0ABT0RW57_9SPHN|nr:OmpA family protein [Sphingomonas caseinilyticus]MCL6699046.1 OmpA family protein [Sphingomonas caseinilyticus]